MIPQKGACADEKHMQVLILLQMAHMQAYIVTAWPQTMHTMHSS
jgi:hypothetical protein